MKLRNFALALTAAALLPAFAYAGERPQCGKFSAL